MYILIGLLTLLAAACVTFSVRNVQNGYAWIKWDVRKKVDYAAQALSLYKKRGSIITKPVEFYTSELDIFYLKDDSNLAYNISSVIQNLITIHEP